MLDVASIMLDVASMVLDVAGNLNSTTNTVYDDDTGISRVSHAKAIIGYDDNKRAFRNINSWGTYWGDGGYGWIAYAFVTNAKLGATAYVLQDKPNTPIPGDVNGNMCVVNTDYAALQASYNACLPSPHYNSHADFNSDGCVDFSDYLLLSEHWNEGC